MRIKLIPLGVAIFVLGFSVASHAQSASGIVDPSRMINWSNVGIPGGVPNRTTICTTLNPGATAAQITSAIASCPAGDVVYLNAGTYNISDGGIDFANHSNVTLRGAGANQTFLVFTNNTSCHGQTSTICFENSDNNWAGGPTNSANWTAGYAKGTTQITLSGTSNLKAGSLLILDQLDDSSDTGGVWVCEIEGTCAQEGIAGGERTNRAQQQFVKVTAVSGSTVTISPGLYMPNWRSSQQPGAWWPTTVIAMSGVENLSIDATNSGASHNITLINAYNCWVKGVRSLDASRDHVNLYQAAASIIRDSYFYGTQNAASESYGVESFMSSDVLVENNIFQHIVSPIMVNGSGSGSVWGYNFSIDDYYSVSPGWMMYSINLHAAGIDNLLFEGNETNGFVGDDVHGTHNFVTVFRNQLLGWETGKNAETTPIQNQFAARYFNIIGNVLGYAGFHNEYQDIPPTGVPCPGGNQSSTPCGDTSIYAVGWFGNEGAGTPTDSLAVSTLMRWGNYDVVNQAARWVASEVPAGLSVYANAVPLVQTLPASFYLSSQPAFWGTTPWPGIGPDVTGGADPSGHAYMNPAETCYTNVMGGPSNGSGSYLSFNAATCYGNVSSSAPLPPTNVQALAQ